MTAVRSRPGRREVPVRTMVIVLGLMGGLLLPSFAALPSGGRDVGLLLLGLVVAGVGCLSFRFSVWSTIAVFVFSAMVRRIFPAADVGADLTAVIPFLVAVPLAARGLRETKPVSLVLLLGWISVVAVLSLGQPAQAIGGWLNLAVPMLAATAIVTIPGGLEALCGSTVVCGAIAATYGIAQYFSPFSWDLAWLNQSNFAKFGTPLFRPFGTLPAPRTAALLSGVVILILIFRPTLVKVPRAVKVWALVANTVFILPAQVRNIWVSVAFAALVGAFISRARVTRRLIVPGAVVALIIVASPLGAVVANRAASLTDLGGDASYQSRLGLVRKAGAIVSPIGQGLGSLSSGTRGDQNAVENGYVVMLGETGLIGAALLLWVLATTARQLKPSEAPFFAFLVLTNMGGFLFSGFGGLLLWSLCGLGRAPPSPATTDTDAVDAAHQA